MFKKMTKKTLLASAVVLAISTGAFAGQQSKVPSVCEGINLNANVPIPPYKLVSQRDVYGLCEMILSINGEMVPVYATKNFVIAGEMFSHKHQVTVEHMRDITSNILKSNFAQVKKELDGIVITRFNPKAPKYVYLIVDPTCPYCESSKSKIADMAEKYNFGVKLVFYPIHGNESTQKIESFVCSKNSFNDYIKDKYGQKTCPNGKSYIDKSIKVNEDLKVEGTPTVITYKGDYIFGYQPDKILQALGVKK